MKKTINDNILIAEFMGVKIDQNGRYNAGYSIEFMKYNSSWDWLMPVVDKVEDLGFWINIKKNHVTIARDNKGSFDSNIIHSEFGDQTKIQRVYSCVVFFIKFYNQSKTK